MADGLFLGSVVDTMRYVVFTMILLITISCSAPFKGEPGSAGPSCQIQHVSQGTQVSCPGSDPQIIPDGSQGPSGPQGATGTPGLGGAPGLTGGTGATGQPGASGPTGADGTPGSTISLIQLCASSFVPTYPSVFPEYALCLEGQLYGVYSANGGFLALLPPGQYSSDGINASCTFTILPNCVIVD